VKKRNQHRYESTMNHGKQYDAKNMMHTFRLLHMAKEIALTGSFNLKRTDDKDFLWKIRKGEFEYDELVQMAEQLIKEINGLSSNAPIREEVDMGFVNRLLGGIRNDFYDRVV